MLQQISLGNYENGEKLKVIVEIFRPTLQDLVQPIYPFSLKLSHIYTCRNHRNEHRLLSPNGIKKIIFGYLRKVFAIGGNINRAIEFSLRFKMELNKLTN